MSQCPKCTAGLGIITVYRLERFVTIECPKCRGVGYSCSGCGGNPATCKCDDNQKTEPNRKALP